MRTARQTRTAADVELVISALRVFYGAEVRSVAWLRTVYGLVLADGRRWIWKWARPVDDEQRLERLYGVLTCLRSHGITAAGPIPNRHGTFLTPTRDGRVGYVQPWLTGRHLNAGHRQERLGAIAAVAHMHMAAREHPWVQAMPVGYWPLYEKLYGKRVTLAKAWPTACRHLPELRPLGDELMEAAAAAAAALVRGGQATERAAYLRRRSFCHRDLAPHNILWTGAGRIGLIDFDQAGPDDPLGDVLQLVHHFTYMRLPDPGTVGEWLTVYTRVHPLPPEEEQRLWRLLFFPDLFIRTVSEWVKAGCPDSRKVRVVAALRAERRKWQVLRRDWAERWGGAP